MYIERRHIISQNIATIGNLRHSKSSTATISKLTESFFSPMQNRAPEMLNLGQLVTHLCTFRRHRSKKQQVFLMRDKVRSPSDIDLMRISVIFRHFQNQVGTLDSTTLHAVKFRYLGNLYLSIIYISLRTLTFLKIYK